MLEELELGLKPVKTFEVDEKFFDEFRSSDGANQALQPARQKPARG